MKKNKIFVACDSTNILKVKRIDHGVFKNVSNKLDSEYFRFILDGQLLKGVFEISGNSCRLSKNY